MKTIQMTVEDSLLSEVDRVIHELKITRDAFMRSALQFALRKHTVSKLEQQQAQGYAQHPAAIGEFDVWEDEQVWGEA